MGGQLEKRLKIEEWGGGREGGPVHAKTGEPPAVQSGETTLEHNGWDPAGSTSDIEVRRDDNWELVPGQGPMSDKGAVTKLRIIIIIFVWGAMVEASAEPAEPEWQKLDQKKKKKKKNPAERRGGA